MGHQCSGSSPACAAKSVIACVPRGMSSDGFDVVGVTVWGLQGACTKSLGVLSLEARTSRSTVSMFKEAALASSASWCSVPRRARMDAASSVARDRASERVRISCSKSASGMCKLEV